MSQYGRHVKQEYLQRFYKWDYIAIYVRVIFNIITNMCLGHLSVQSHTGGNKFRYYCGILIYGHQMYGDQAERMKCSGCIKVVFLERMGFELGGA